MMTCKGACERMTDAAEGKLSGFTLFRYKMHLAICPYCNRYRAQLEQTVEGLKDLPQERPPEGLAADLLQRHRSKKP